MAAATYNVSGVAALRILLSTATTQLFFTNAVDGQVLQLILQQDGTGGRLVTSGNCPGLLQPSTLANDDSICTLIYDASINEWGAIAEQLAPGALAVKAYTTNASIGWARGLVTLSGTLTLTITNPVAGPPGVGNDGEVMIFSSIGAGVQKVTMTTTSTINASSTSASNAGAVGDGFQLMAFGGNVYLVEAFGATTLS